MHASAQYISIISIIQIIWTRKLAYIFLISNQLEAHSSSWRLTSKLRTTIYPSDFYHCILSIFLIQRWSSLPSHINFSTSSTIDIAIWRKTQGLYALLQLASNCLVASARGQIETCASYRYQQQFCCLRNGSGCNGLQLLSCGNRKVASASALV